VLKGEDGVTQAAWGTSGPPLRPSAQSYGKVARFRLAATKRKHNYYFIGVEYASYAQAVFLMSMYDISKKGQNCTYAIFTM
jgi:hypothetical protein